MVAGLYIPPSLNATAANAIVEKVLKKCDEVMATSTRSITGTLVLGDINADIYVPANEMGRQIRSTIREYGASILPQQTTPATPTFVAHQGSTVIDHVIEMGCVEAKPLHVDVTFDIRTDHRPVTVDYRNLMKPRNEQAPPPREFWRLTELQNPATRARYRHQIRLHTEPIRKLLDEYEPEIPEMDETEKTLAVNTLQASLVAAIKEAVNATVSKSRAKNFSSTKPFCPPDLRRLLRLRRTYLTQKKDRELSTIEIARLEEVSKIIDEKQQELRTAAYHSHMDEVDANDESAFTRMIKLQKRGASKTNYLDLTAEALVDGANHFEKHFCPCRPDSDTTLRQLSPTEATDLPSDIFDDVDWKEPTPEAVKEAFSVKAVRLALAGTGNNKAAGDDGIAHEMLRYAATTPVL